MNDIRANRDWLRLHGQEYSGWIAIKDGVFLGTAPSLQDLIDQLGVEPRHSGILFTRGMKAIPATAEPNVVSELEASAKHFQIIVHGHMVDGEPTVTLATAIAIVGRLEDALAECRGEPYSSRPSDQSHASQIKALSRAIEHSTVILRCRDVACNFALEGPYMPPSFCAKCQREEMLVAEPVLALERQVERLEEELTALRRTKSDEVGRLMTRLHMVYHSVAALERKLADAEALVLDNVGARHLLEERLAALTTAMEILKNCGVLKQSLYPVSDWQVVSAALNQPEVPALTCLWIQDMDGIYISACGKTWFFDDGSSLADNNCRFCFYCGKGIKETGSEAEEL